MGDILALDYGDRRIGVARAQEVARIAEPLQAIDKNKVDAIDEIKRLINVYQVSRLVLGLPRNLSGEDTEQTKKTRVFAKQLQEETELKVELIDEALSSVNAESMSSKFDKDSLAACQILTDFLNQKEQAVD
jgi:putative holliday junction resolvase